MHPLLLAGDSLDEAFPWHLVFDYGLRIRSAGADVRRLIPDLDGAPLDESFELLPSPKTAWRLRSYFHPDLVLQGRLLRTTDGLLVFAGEPMERERDDRRELAQRLEAVGQLASGIAHEINTPIQYIADSVQFIHDSHAHIASLDASLVEAIGALQRLGELEISARLASVRDDADADYLLRRMPEVFERTFYGLERVRGIIGALRGFARKTGESIRPADINEAIQSTLKVARNEYKYVADVITDLATLPPLPCRVQELEQVILNLIVNAAHAIEETGRRGQLAVRTRARAGAVEIEVSDDGVGIPDHVRRQIFDPFFTTKARGKGTGQGLPISLSIVRRHGGSIDVKSKAGAGSTFVVTLPVGGEAYS